MAGDGFMQGDAIDDVSRPFLWTDVPADALTFDTATRPPMGNVRVDIYLDKTKTRAWEAIKGSSKSTSQRLRVQTPRFRKFSTKEWPGEQGKANWSGSFALGDLEGVGAPAKFVREWVRPMEAAIIRTAADRSLEWFKKRKDEKELQVMWNSCVNEGGESAQGRQYGPLLNCKIPFVRGRFLCDFYKGDGRRESSMKEFLHASDNGREAVDCVAILEFDSIVFRGKAFSARPVLSQLVFWPQDRLRGFSFLPDPASGTGDADDEARGPADAFLDCGPPPKKLKAAPEPEERDDQ